MRYWLRGKGGGLMVFFIITALVLGGLGWVTATAFRLEAEQMQARKEQLEAQARADFFYKLRLALYRLDSLIAVELSKEVNRPFYNYAVQECTPGSDKGTPSVLVCSLVPLPGVETNRWALGNVMLASPTDWGAPQMLRQTIIHRLSVSASPTSQPQKPAELSILVAELSEDAVFKNLVAACRPVEPAPLVQASQLQENVPKRLNENVQNPVGLRGNMAKQSSVDPDTVYRHVQSEQLRSQTAYAANVKGENKKNSDQENAPIPGAMIPLWLTARGGRQPSDTCNDRLVVARLWQIGRRSACQVTLLDWPVLQRTLAETVHDLFPQATFRPDRGGSFPAPERTMTALPVVLEPGPEEMPTVVVPDLDGRPLRIGLGLTWTAALFALAAVGLGGWSLIDLSERRIRFVSAVTHELRTPMTTLRLYLDMLTGGFVKDDQQKKEYLQTLHAEADRLNRLIGNVLDFSRLENQRPRLNMTRLPLGQLLRQVQDTWHGRCRDAGKELVIANSLEAETELHTDADLVQQILGNLIDNACKYSQDAADPHIWLRAYRQGDRLVLEVEDRGPGIPPAERRAIFRAFRRGDKADVTAGGVGLGLALAQRWAELMGGCLTLRPGPEHAGACFRVELPLKKEVSHMR